MKIKLAVLALSAILAATAVLAENDPLPSWRDTTSKKAIIAFVARVTDRNSTDFVPPAERIATFDNDGTLWAEQPIYFSTRLRARPRESAPGGGLRFTGLVHHDDAVREWAYDRKSSIGKLDKAWDEAGARGWTVVSMKDDWKRILPFDP